MSIPPILSNLRLPVIGAPLFIVSNPKLVIAQCTAGVVGSFPALNARPATKLDEWMHEITEALAAHDRAHPDAPSAPFAVNQIVHRTNDRFEHDIVCSGPTRADLKLHDPLEARDATALPRRHLRGPPPLLTAPQPIRPALA